MGTGPAGEGPDTSGLGGEAVAAFRRAEDLVTQRRPREALTALEPVLHIGADKPSVQLLLGRAYYFAAQLGRAESAFSRVLELDPSDHYARLALGRTLQRQGRLAEARAQLRLAATMSPTPTYQEALGEINAHIALRDR
ncbi:tetratricopeptide repeat protein [Salinifilum aidingensis]